MTMSTHEFKVNSTKADIAVNVPNEDNMIKSTHKFKLNLNKADIAIYVPTVAKHDMFKTQ